MKDFTFSKCIYWLAKICFMLSLALFIFVVSGVLIHFAEELFSFNSGLLERINDGGKESVFLHIPLIKFGIGFPAKSLMSIFMIAFFGFYTLYFYLMKNFFGIFKNNESFSKENIKTSDYFLLVNFVPILFWLGFTIYYLIIGKQTNIFDEEFFILLIHLFVIILIYLYRDILKKGFYLKEENDLTI